MEWLKDRKNLPIIIGLLAVVIIAAGVLIAYTSGAFGTSGAATTTAATTPTPGAAPETPGAPPGGAPSPAETAGGPPSGGFGPYGGGGGPYGGAPGSPAAAGAAAPAGAATLVKATGPVSLTAKDPFVLKGDLSPAKTALKIPTPHLRDSLPGVSIAQVKDKAALKPPAPPVPSRIASAAVAGMRVSGIIYSHGVSAILESNGQSEAVQPGSTVDAGKVVSIQSDGLTLRTDTNQILNIPLTGTVTTGGGNFGGGFPGGPGGFPGGYGGFPGGPGGKGGFGGAPSD